MMIGTMKRTSLKDVALAANASLSTVSAAMNNKPGVSEERKTEILRIADSLGYKMSLAAKVLKTKHLNDMGLIIAEKWTKGFINIGFFHLIGDVLRESQVRHVNTQLEWFSAQGDELLPSMLTNGMAGGILFAGKGTPAVERYIAGELNIPLVRIMEPGQYSVRFDVHGGMVRFIQYLASRGHQRIALLNGSHQIDIFHQIESAYRETIGYLQLDTDPSLYLSGEVKSDFSLSMRKYADDLVATNPDAVIVVGGMLSSWVAAEFLRRGIRIPDDISFTAFASLEWETTLSMLPLTGMYVDYSAIASASLTMLKNLMSGHYVGQPSVLIPLYLRDYNTVKEHS